jgi:hypothetical protein
MVTQLIPPDLNAPMFLRYAISNDGHFVEVVPESIKTALRTQQGMLIYGNITSDSTNYSRTIDEPSEEIQFDIRCPAFSIGKLNPMAWASAGIPNLFDSGNHPLSFHSFVPVEGEVKRSNMPGITSDIDWINTLKLKARKGEPLTIAIYRSQGYALQGKKDYFTDNDKFSSYSNPAFRDIANDLIANNMEFPIYYESKQEKKYKIVEISVSEEATQPFWAIVSITAEEWKPAVWYTGTLSIDSGNSGNSSNSSNTTHVVYDSDDFDKKLIAGQTTRLALGASLRQVSASAVASGIASKIPPLPNVISNRLSSIRNILPFNSSLRGIQTVTRPVPRIIGISWNSEEHTEELSDIPLEDMIIPPGTEVPLNEYIQNIQNI